MTRQNVSTVGQTRSALVSVQTTFGGNIRNAGRIQELKLHKLCHLVAIKYKVGRRWADVQPIDRQWHHLTFCAAVNVAPSLKNTANADAYNVDSRHKQWFSSSFFFHRSFEYSEEMGFLWQREKVRAKWQLTIKWCTSLPTNGYPHQSLSIGMCVTVSGHAVWHNAGNLHQNARIARKQPIL